MTSPFAFDAGPQRLPGMIEQAALDACEPDAPRADVLEAAARLILQKLASLKTAEAVRRNFWMNSGLIAEMAEVCPEHHDKIVDALFWSCAPRDVVDRYCDAGVQLHLD